jgi:parallel beta-helix repeat protein
VYSPSFFAQCLTGNYSIPNDYPSFSAAVNALNTRGVCGPVTFTIQPGVYTEHITLSEISGTSAVNTVTFQSAASDSTAVRLQFGGNDSLPDVITFNGADYVTFRGIHIKRTIDSTFSSTLAILIYENSDQNKLSHCLIETTTMVDNNGYEAMIFSNAFQNNHFTMEYNTISGGKRGVWIYGQFKNSSFTANRNTFKNQFSKGIDLTGVSNVFINNNRFDYFDKTSYLGGIHLFTGTDSCIVSGNQIHLGKTYDYGLGIEYIKNVLAYNNVVIARSGPGIMLYNSENVRIYHNTVVSNHDCVYASGNKSLRIKNNILYQKGGGTSLYALNNDANYESDYNDLYSPDINKSFKEWKKKTGQDQHSLNFLPAFISDTDLHILSNFSQNLTLPYLPEVPTDIDGNPRDTGSPYFGAYEFANDANLPDAGVEIVTPGKNCMGSVKIQAQLKNYSALALQSAVLSWSVDDVLQPSVNWTGSLNQNAEALVDLGTVNHANLSSYRIKVWSSFPNGNADTFHDNDTDSITSFSRLKGTYTVGGTNPDFATLGNAAATLTKGGVCGSVTLNIRGGTYKESVVIRDIDGLEGTNTLTITSEAHSADSVRLSGSTSYDAILLQNVKNVVVRDLSFFDFWSDLTRFTIGDSVENIELTKCFVSFVTSHNHKNYVRNIRILNNIFGKYIIDFESYSKARFKNVQIRNNIFNTNPSTETVKPTLTTISLQGIDSLEYSNNKLANYTLYAPSMTVKNSSSVTISKNDLAYYDQEGLSLENVSDVLVSNNMLSAGAASSRYSAALKIFDCHHFTVINNSIQSYFVHYEPATVQFGNATGSCKFWNNAIVNFGSGRLIDYYLPHTIDFKNNAYFFNGTFGSGKTTFPEWQQYSGDSTSFITDPRFKSNNNLHITEISLKDAGADIAGIITEDYDGELRDDMPDIGADELPTVVSIHATISKFFPSSAVKCPGQNPIQLTLKNSGTISLTAVDLQYSVNQDIFNYHWTGSLKPGKETQVTLGTYNFKSHTEYTLTAKCRNLNDSTGIGTVHDSVYTSFTTALKGTYTIGGNTPDFSDLSAAASAMQYYGICGPVVFNIRDGIYYGQIFLPYIKGNSNVNPITFQSENQDSTLVTVLFRSPFLTSPVIRIDSVSHISFLKMSFKVEEPGYVEVFNLSRTHHCVIQNCAFIGPVNELSETRFIMTSASVDSLTVSNNSFTRGRIALTSKGTHTEVIHNYFESQFKHSITGSGTDFFYAYNAFNCTNNYSGSTISLSGQTSGSISKNRFLLTGKGFKGIAFEKAYADGVVISNNFMVLTGGNGIFMNNTKRIQVMHNSLHQKGDGVCLLLDTTDLTVCKNNIYYTSSAKNHCVALKNNTNYSSDYNCIYNATDSLIVQNDIAFTSLQTYAAQTSNEKHSIAWDPKFKSDTDLHATDFSIARAGTFVPAVMDDIDNESRDTQHPSIGADEFIAPPGTVWPGDANNDSVANNVDLLNIGLYYGETGFARATVSNDWMAFHCQDWSQLQSNGRNMKHADCNGDGTVDANDTLAIRLNFSSVHAKHTPKAAIQAPNLQFKTDKPVYAAGEWITVDIIAGTPQNPAENLYGIAFNISYSAALAEPGTEQLTFSQSWLAKPGTNALTFAKIDRALNLIFIAQTGTDHSNKNGAGVIATFKFQANKMMTSNSTMKFSIASCVANDAVGQEKVFASIPHQIDVVPVITPVDNGYLPSTVATAYPNPYHSATTISYSLREEANVQLEVFNSMGQQIQVLVKGMQHSGEYSCVFSAAEQGLSKGVYFVKLTVNNKTTLLKIVEF